MIVESQSGHGNAVSLPPLIVGTRHCRVLYIIPMQPETISGAQWNNQFGVSIPSRGSGKGDLSLETKPASHQLVGFQSPLGEVVKETPFLPKQKAWRLTVSIPSRGSGKGDLLPVLPRSDLFCFNPLSGKW